MAADSDDPARKPTPLSQPISRTNPNEGPGLESSQAGAMERFKRNSERLQARQAEGFEREGSQVSSKSQDAPGGQSRDAEPNRGEGAGTQGQGQDQQQSRDQSDGNLQFAKDHERGARAELKTEASKDPHKELSFAKDRERGARADLKIEHSKTQGKELSFAKDQSQGQKHGR